MKGSPLPCFQYFRLSLVEQLPSNLPPCRGRFCTRYVHAIVHGGERGKVGRSAKNLVPEITAAVLRKAYGEPPPPGRSYYIQERGGKNSIPGCFIRVLRTEIWFGTRNGSTWLKVAKARPGMTTDEVLVARRAVRAKVTQLEERPAAQARILVRQLMDLHLTDWRSGRGEHRSPRTEEGYRELWSVHILPFLVDPISSGRLLGDMPIQEVSPLVAQQVKLRLPALVTSRLPQAKRGGTVVTNRVLQQLQAAFKYAVRMEWISANPFSEDVIIRYAEVSDGYAFSQEELKAIGDALVRLEALTARPRPPLPYRSLAGIRLLLLTGARPSELTEAYTHRRHLPTGSLDPYAILEDPYPRIHVQRAKGDRGKQKRAPGRFIWLASRATELVEAIPRVPGDVHILPGDIPGDHLQRLNKAFDAVLKEAGVKRVPLKCTRHSFRTWAPEAGVSPEHVQQLLGHAGLRMTDTVYLHSVAPALMAAAHRAAEFMAARLSGEPWAPGAMWGFGAEPSGMAAAHPRPPQ